MLQIRAFAIYGFDRKLTLCATMEAEKGIEKRLVTIVNDPKRPLPRLEGG